MLAALALVCRQAREEAGLTQLDIATPAGVSHETISRFERGDGWPQGVGRIIRIYEAECGLEPFTLWARAVRLAREGPDS